MNYNAMTVHCASLCLDVINQNQFFNYSESDIFGFQHEVKQLIKERLQSSTYRMTNEDEIVKALAEGVINVLLHYRRHIRGYSTEFILGSIQSQLIDLCMDDIYRRNTYGTNG
ncbi:hypothetical protein [Vibrio viridaestus]|uniref:Uncharacterized protein n=1 Tax=Vibrio viridaestus TaxID=2487322 RepID=A0A3N9TAM6_9VIBR|nr:hypothetical protein [Vibrio viridaestus]RQW61168.1 hypothetical protein EES38_20545 [Vibrio viridaestus]